MKPKERLLRMRKSVRQWERFMLAADRVPGSKFDREILAAMHYSAECFNDLDNRYRDFQYQMLMAIRKGRSGFFRELADALDVYHSHKPYQQSADKVRQAVLWRNAVALSEGRVLRVKDIIAHLRATRFPVGENTPRVVRLVAKEFGIPINGDSGRPRKQGKS